MKLICRSCKYEQFVEDRSVNHCPQCGSNDITIFLFGKPSKQKIKQYICRKCKYEFVVIP